MPRPPEGFTPPPDEEIPPSGDFPPPEDEEKRSATGGTNRDPYMKLAKLYFEANLEREADRILGEENAEWRKESMDRMKTMRGKHDFDILTDRARRKNELMDDHIRTYEEYEKLWRRQLGGEELLPEEQQRFQQLAQKLTAVGFSPEQQRGLEGARTGTREGARALLAARGTKGEVPGTVVDFEPNQLWEYQEKDRVFVIRKVTDTSVGIQDLDPQKGVAGTQRSIPIMEFAEKAKSRGLWSGKILKPEERSLHKGRYREDF